MSLVRTVSEKVAIDIAPSTAFLRVLDQERKRTERSGRPFMLALISGECLRDGERRGLAQSIAASIACCTREIDSLGWYEQDLTLGVLLTEIGLADKAKVELLVEKISSAIQRTVTPEDFCRLSLAIRVLPHHSKDAGYLGSREEVIYRDLYRKPWKTRQADALKRVVDIVGSCIFLMLLSPFFIVIAALVKMTSNGSMFYCQTRVGQYGKLFKFFKFRTMHADNDPSIHREYVTKLIEGEGQARQSDGTYKLAADPRITPLGRILRKTSLDELPQFVNVLLGDISLVGPRPPLPYEFECYRAWHKRRLMEIQARSDRIVAGLWTVKDYI